MCDWRGRKKLEATSRQRSAEKTNAETKEAVLTEIKKCIQVCVLIFLLVIWFVSRNFEGAINLFK